MRFAWKWKTTDQEEEDRLDDLKDRVERVMFFLKQAQEQLSELQQELNK